MGRACPADGNLRDAAALERLLTARATSNKDLIILILGWTNGGAQITMRESGVAFIEAQISALRDFGLGDNYIVLTPSLPLTLRAGSNNICRNVLQPRRICCGWSSIGLDHEFHANNSYKDRWGLFPTHPFYLFVQRWWLAAEALVRGFNILSLDADLHLSTNPLDLVRSPALRAYDVLFQGDGHLPMRVSASAEDHTPSLARIDPHLSRLLRSQGLPSEQSFAGGRHAPVSLTSAAAVEAAVLPVENGTHVMSLRSKKTDPVVVVGCERPSLQMLSSSSEPPRGPTCVCESAVAAPALNTGFVWARSGRVGTTTRLFNATVNAILRRLQQPPVLDSRGMVHQARLWPQAVMNEQVFIMARQPTVRSGASAPRSGTPSAREDTATIGSDMPNDPACHPLDVDCMPWKLPRVALADGVLMPERWWVTPSRRSSVWRASALDGDDPTGDTPPPACANAATRSTTATEANVGRGRLVGRQRLSGRPFLSAHLLAHTQLDEDGTTLGVLPRTLVGRLCAKRRINLANAAAEMTAVSPAQAVGESLPCPALSGPMLLGQHVQHLQFTNMYTRKAVYAAMGWGGDQPFRGRKQHSIGKDLGCGYTLSELLRYLNERKQEPLGVVMGSPTSGVSLLCAIVTNASTVLRCPCCWLAPATVASETTSCLTWNPHH